MNRRHFLTLGASSLAAAAGGCALIASNTTSHLETKRTTIKIPGLPTPFHNYRIGFLSDLHLSVFILDEFIEEAVKKVRDEQVDVLLLGGDYIWIDDTPLSRTFGYFKNERLYRISERELPDVIFSSVASIVRHAACPDGIFAVHGNHDRWVDPRACERAFASQNISFLINDVVEIKRGNARLQILGTDDYWTGVPRFPLKEPIDRAHEARILLTHNPDYASFVMDRTPFEFDLAFCGHTHGGQIRIPGVGAIIHNIQDWRLASGLFESSTHKVYTSRGVGVVELPFRVNCPPEVSIITLARV